MSFIQFANDTKVVLTPEDIHESFSEEKDLTPTVSRAREDAKRGLATWLAVCIITLGILWISAFITDGSANPPNSKATNPPAQHSPQPAEPSPKSAQPPQSASVPRSPVMSELNTCSSQDNFLRFDRCSVPNGQRTDETFEFS